MFAGFVLEILMMYCKSNPNSKFVFVYDNCSTHFSKVTCNILNNIITTIKMPAYSP